MASIALAGATAVLRQTVGVLGDLVLKEGSRLSRLRGDIVWIEREMRHIQAYLEDAEAKQRGSRGVANLVIDIRELACDVEDIMQKYYPRIASHRGKKFLGCFKSATCIVCYGYDARNFAVEIEGIKRRVEDITRVRQTYGINESSGSGGRDMWDERRSFPHIDEPNVVGFEKHIEDLVAKMLNKELQCRVISIIGMAGLGKTTLAKKIFKSAQHNFQLSAWIYVSQQPNIKELLRDIARQVGLEKEKWEENVEVPSFCGINLDRIFYRTETCLPNLQTLYGLTEEVGCDFSFLPRLVNLRKLGVNNSSTRVIEILSDPRLVLTKLEKLSLLSGLISGEKLGTWNLSRYENLLSLKLEYIGWWNSKLPQHDTLPPNLTKLTLSYNYLEDDPMETLKKLPKLRILKLYYKSYMGSKMVCPGAPGCNFPQLEVLKIELLEKLEELIVEEGGMPRLKELGFFLCNPITTVPDRIKNIMKIHNDMPLRRFNRHCHF
ncbi:putative disease resistance protein [Camellia lanceoleosa]|uniref:Disease resistance protein n=1 Tax=Camellia lanceoleosa TaxID=1840588 RepID=A0ACC0IEJ7_9ERIC|nr:putative disease resistance protein [Camellia lanceoleosa]